MFRILTAAFILALTVTANAGEVAVSLKGLDLTNPANSQVLASRIHAAAEQACGPADTSDNRTSAVIEARDRHQDCLSHAYRTVLATIRSQPRLAGTAAIVKLASN